jgi:ABC-2 type transport system ATP-binding protein
MSRNGGFTGSASVIQTSGLTKRYGSTIALDSLSLAVQQGEIFGYLGPNGAGKTTTIRILMDLIRATSGSASIFGLNTRADSVEIHKRIGFMPGELNLWGGQTAINVIRYFARVRGGVDMNYVHELAERLDFDVRKRIRDYSSGNKRKLGLILALMNQPELLILDEPTGGFDPLMQQTFNDMMREWRAAGRTVFLSSHVLGEVQAICDRVGILRNGKLTAVETVARLTHVDFRWVEMRLRDANIPQNLDRIEGVSEVSVQDNVVRLRLMGDFDPLLKAMNNAYISDIRVSEPTLEEIFLTFYGERNNHKRDMVKEVTK